MRNRALLSALAACFAISACEAKKEEPPKPKTAQAVVPLPPEAPKPAAASANQDANPVMVAQVAAAPAKMYKTGEWPLKNGKRGGCGSGKCKVKVTVDDQCKFTYNAYDLSVFGKGETISWHLTGGWKFEGKGIDLPEGSGQFSKPEGIGTQTVSVVDKNDKDTKKYKYSVFVVNGSKHCKDDPSVVNGADYEDPDYPS